MSIFTDAELRYLLEERDRAEKLARIATVDRFGMPHVTPVGWSYNQPLAAIDIGGIQFERTKKFRDVQSTGVAAVVIDDVLPPWKPRGIEIRGRAEPIGGPTPLIRIHPDRVVSWGLSDEATGDRHARTVTRNRPAPITRSRT